MERIWRDKENSYIRILPQAIKVNPRGCSSRFERVLSDFGFERSFRLSVQAVKEHYGFEIGESTVAKTTCKHAKSIECEHHKRANPRGLPPKGSKQLIAQADGSFVRIVSTDIKAQDRRKSRRIDYREARLCAAQSHGCKKVHYEATFGEVEQVGQYWLQASKQAGLAIESAVHGVSDGAPWIEDQFRSIFKQTDRFLIDFYHVCQYLSEASVSCSDKPKRWMNTQKKRLKTGHPKKVIKCLSEHLENDTFQDQDAPVRRAHRYISKRVKSLDYKGAIELNLPIGSGLIESGHKHVLQARMKIPGASWSIENAQAFLQARTVRANGNWDSYWNTLAA